MAKSEHACSRGEFAFLGDPLERLCSALDPVHEIAAFERQEA